MFVSGDDHPHTMLLAWKSQEGVLQRKQAHFWQCAPTVIDLHELQLHC